MHASKYSLGILFCILALAGSAMFFTARTDSAIMDELPHIPAGYSYVSQMDFRLNPEHPPLVKALAALPLLGMDIHFPENDKSWKNDVNGQWDFGRVFLYESGNNAQEIITRARIFPILLTLLLGLFIYLWARERMGKLWALLPAALFVFSPTVLAHGHYVTTDIGAALGALIALFAFVLFLERPSGKSLFIAGIALGIAELMKFSNVLLFPILGILMLFYYLGERMRGKANIGIKRFFKYIASYALICLIAFALIYSVYFLFTAKYPLERQISDTTSILSVFKNRTLAEPVIAMAGNPVLRPLGEYFLGVLMVIDRSTGGNTGYFVGEIASQGWWYYFPLIFVLKETIPTLLILALGLSVTLISLFKTRGHERKRFGEYLSMNFHEFAMLFFILAYWGWSMKSPLNIGVRHLLPTLPLLYILAAGSVKKFFETRNEKLEGSGIARAVSEQVMRPFGAQSAGTNVKKIALAGILVWFTIETASAFPNYLSYFNQIGGGIENGHRFATDSNYDWGQDLLRLGQWVETERKAGRVQKIAIDYFGGGDIRSALGEAGVPWNSEKGNPRDAGIEWIAVSVNTLSQAMAKEAKGFSRPDEREYEFLREKNPSFAEGFFGVPAPDARAGTSIFLYHL